MNKLNFKIRSENDIYLLILECEHHSYEIKDAIKKNKDVTTH